MPSPLPKVFSTLNKASCLATIETIEKNCTSPALPSTATTELLLTNNHLRFNFSTSGGPTLENALGQMYGVPVSTDGTYDIDSFLRISAVVRAGPVHSGIRNMH